MVLVNVQWYSRMSGRNPEAENLRLNTSDAPLANDGEHHRHERVAVEHRHRAVEDVVGPEPHGPDGRPGGPTLGQPDRLGGAGRSRR